jgi:hypothetical protein
VKFATVRPGTAVSGLLLDLFWPGGGRTRTIRPDTLERAVRRAERMGLIHRVSGMRLTVRGRWHCVALHMGVSVPELAALACIYAQLGAWEGEPALQRLGRAFAVRDPGAFAPDTYRTATIRDIYNRLVMKGLIRHGGSSGTVTLPRHVRERLEPYAADLAALLNAARGVHNGSGRGAPHRNGTARGGDTIRYRLCADHSTVIKFS